MPVVGLFLGIQYYTGFRVSGFRVVHWYAFPYEYNKTIRVGCVASGLGRFFSFTVVSMQAWRTRNPKLGARQACKSESILKLNRVSYCMGDLNWDLIWKTTHVRSIRWITRGTQSPEATSLRALTGLWIAVLGFRV